MPGVCARRGKRRLPCHVGRCSGCTVTQRRGVAVSARRAISYARVSTARQGASGLALEAQRGAVQAYAAASGQSIITEGVEGESGRRDERPQLAAAFAACRLHRATLVIAKLDRLARDVRFIAGIVDCGLDFVACDMPHAKSADVAPDGGHGGARG
ncbi:recombinase family protein [Sphingomonas endolithica]|uniref:recombinase family protein n=1 Tax=Sphingomonas endolithica TaxID=2972485 RepID=UPI003AADD507